MTTACKPNLPMSRALVEQLLAEQYPEFDASGLVHVSTGWSHDVWRCGGTVLRFPREPAASPTSEAASLLAPLSAVLPLPVPVATHWGRPTPAYPGGFVGYHWIPGEVAFNQSLSESERAAIAAPLALVLRVLHGVPIETARSWGAATTDRQSELELRTQRGHQRATRLANSAYARLAASSAAAMTPPPAPCTTPEYRLVHGDLHAGQVLLGPARQLAGILDWDDVRIGDPAYDMLRSTRSCQLPPCPSFGTRTALSMARPEHDIWHSRTGSRSWLERSMMATRRWLRMLHGDWRTPYSAETAGGSDNATVILLALRLADQARLRAWSAKRSPSSRAA